jgi:acetylornithine deacetylase
MFKLLSHWIDTPSPTGEETKFAEMLYDWLVEQHYVVQRQPVSPGRFNILASAGPSCRVLFCTHMDTVLPYIPCRIDAEIIHGRGSCDAKGILYAMIMAGESLRRQGIDDFGYLFVVGEERDSDGAKAAAASALHSDYVILGEPTGNRLVGHQKGALVFQVAVAGKAGHSGYPEYGTSAIHRLLHLVQAWLSREWPDDPLLGATTLNIGRIRGGQAVNVIADRAEAEGIFRLAVEPDLILDYLRSFADADISIRVLSVSSPQHLHTLPGREAIVVSFGSDAAYLQPIGKVLMVGPGSIHQAHRETEHIYKSEILVAIELYADLVRSLTAR